MLLHKKNEGMKKNDGWKGLKGALSTPEETLMQPIFKRTVNHSVTWVALNVIKQPVNMISETVIRSQSELFAVYSGIGSMHYQFISSKIRETSLRGLRGGHLHMYLSMLFHLCKPY